LKKCHADEPLAVSLDRLHFDDKLHFVKKPVEIVDRELKRLKRSRISLVKVRWNSRRGPEFTWEREDQFRKKYPHLFAKTASSSSVASDDLRDALSVLYMTTAQLSALLPIELTNEDIRNSNAYKEYYAVTTGATPSKPKASVRKTISSSDTIITPPTAAAGPRLTTSEKVKQAAKAFKAKSLSSLSEVAITEAQQLKLATKRSLQQIHISQASSSGADEGTGTLPGVPDVPTDESEEDISWKSTDDEGDDDEGNDGGDDDDGDDGKEGDGDNEDEDDDGEEGNDDDDDQEDERNVEDDEDKGETRDEESFDHIPKIPENSDDEGNGEENFGLNVGREEGHDEEEEEDELYRDVNINQGMGIHTTQKVEDSHVTLTPVNPDGQQ
nr:putative reverse transcriptase domain-containing protein [Tanacetum cinerariifolium]